MTSRAPIALIAAALYLAVQGQPRSEQHSISGPPSPVVCPCGDPNVLIPYSVWVGPVSCSVNHWARGLTSLRHIGDRSNSRANLGSGKGGLSRGSCLFDDGEGGVEEIRSRDLSLQQVRDCSTLIIRYAQALKNARRKVIITDIGCSLQ